ncbi:MAG: hypothetical protein GEU96_21715 [Propionibacteriales bacterium]|nr:hypothetical protein [Propionibacteriales bacterium]
MPPLRRAQPTHTWVRGAPIGQNSTSCRDPHTVPVIAGKGDRLFDGFDLTHLDLVRTTPFKSGIVVHAYAPK